MRTKTDPAHANADVALRNPQTKRDYNRTLFRTVAPRYNLITRILSLGRDSAWKRWMIAHLPADVERAVDLASGTGDLARAVAGRYPEADVTGLDLSPEMLAIARATSPGRIEWVSPTL